MIARLPMTEDSSRYEQGLAIRREVDLFEVEVRSADRSAFLRKLRFN